MGVTWLLRGGAAWRRLEKDEKGEGDTLRAIYSPRMGKWLLFINGKRAPVIPPAATVADLMDNLKSSRLCA